jgi:hypothetical protein
VRRFQPSLCSSAPTSADLKSCGTRSIRLCCLWRVMNLRPGRDITIETEDMAFAALDFSLLELQWGRSRICFRGNTRSSVRLGFSKLNVVLHFSLSLVIFGFGSPLSYFCFCFPIVYLFFIKLLICFCSFMSCSHLITLGALLAQV